MNSQIIEFIARTAHEANRAWCELHGDHSQAHWEQAPEWQRTSAREGVLAVLEGLTPKQLHTRWALLKASDGWTYGAIKDEKKKEHPCLVSFDDLPVHQRQKDELFHRIVTQAAIVAGVL